MTSTDPVTLVGRPLGLIAGGGPSFPLAAGADAELASGGAGATTVGVGGGAADGSASRVESLA
jgi:hypothetical protein